MTLDLSYLPQRFWSKVDLSGDCWLWTADIDSTGYGRYSVNGNRVRAHRVAYEAAKGAVPCGLVLDHVCHNRACINPDHLRPVTVKENGENRVGAQSNSTSGYRGVTWNRNMQKWQVQVGHHGVRYYGGYYESLQDAASAVRDLRNRLFRFNDEDRRPHDD